MAKTLSDAVLDAPADVIDQCTRQIVCSAQPTTYAEANATFALADVTMTADTDYAKANGDTSGRKVTVAAKNAVPIDVTGTGTHVALVIVASSTLHAVTTMTSQPLTAGGTVNIPAWDIETGDPT